MGARGNCLGGSCPDGNYSGAILWKAKVRGLIFLVGKILEKGGE